MKKHLWTDILVIIFSLLISVIISTQIFSYTWLFSYMGITSSLILIFLFAYSLFLVYKLLIKKKDKKIYLKIFLFLYISLFIALLFSRQHPTYGINLKIGYINDYAPYIFWANLLILTPVGFLMKKFYDVNGLVAAAAVVLSVTVLEMLQYLCHKGILDINDIILNSTGFILGMLLHYLYCKIIMKLQNNLSEHTEQDS